MTESRRPTIVPCVKVTQPKNSTKRCNTKTIPSGLLYAFAWVIYVLFGSWIFLVLEQQTEDVSVEHEKWTRFKELWASRHVVQELRDLQTHLGLLCPKGKLNESSAVLFGSIDISETATIPPTGGDLLDNGLTTSLNNDWFIVAEEICRDTFFTVQQITRESHLTMVDGIYYTMTLVTTIGFGLIYPTTTSGRLFCIVYALIGVPLTCILMAKNSAMLSNKMVRLYESVKKRLQWRNPEHLLYAVTWLYFLVGFVVFMLIPSFGFVYLEEWSYSNSIYFTFITLTTIGFGDLVAGYSDKTKPYHDYYQIGIVIWIMLALGYWILLLSFLQKGIQVNAKALKRTLKKKNIAKRARILRQVLTKAKTDSRSGSQLTSTKDKLNMMALLVDSLSRKNSTMDMSNPNLFFGVKKQSSTNKTKEDDSSEEEGEEGRLSTSTQIDLPFSLDDLLNVNISIQTESLPGLDSVMSQLANESNDEISCNAPNISCNTPSISCNAPNNLEPISQRNELRGINLSVREIIALTLFVSSVENDIDPSSLNDTTSEDSDIFTSILIDPKESMPLLKGLLKSNTTQDERNGRAYIDSPIDNFIHIYKDPNGTREGQAQNPKGA